MIKIFNIFTVQITGNIYCIYNNRTPKKIKLKSIQKKYSMYILIKKRYIINVQKITFCYLMKMKSYLIMRTIKNAILLKILS